MSTAREGECSRPDQRPERMPRDKMEGLLHGAAGRPGHWREEDTVRRKVERGWKRRRKQVMKGSECQTEHLVLDPGGHKEPLEFTQ